ncbi:Phosphorylated carbohydrates phosphatase [Baekduia alba]|uniref:HAD family hydrolase n=1 Tax=Baekduia alba TaxID=2997333 RepID=UPI00233FFE77|nr:HAD family phosphatase [Baekduia alba]WCB93448.1 Phosphorylated carbohydrates phosphatase [Baekduia alba]
MAPRPVIFDMDGVLVDSEPMFERVFTVAMRVLGRPDMASWYPNTLGRRQVDFVPPLAAELGRDPEAVFAALRDELPRQLATPLPAMAGVPGAVRRIAEGRRVGLASSSRRSFVEHVLAQLALTDVFGAVATGDEVAHGKPDPALYRLAAQRLAIDPAAATAIEDTPTGIASAKAAGLTVIAIPNAHTAALDLSAADVVLADLHAAADHLAA